MSDAVDFLVFVFIVGLFAAALGVIAIMLRGLWRRFLLLSGLSLGTKRRRMFRGAGSVTDLQ